MGSLIEITGFGKLWIASDKSGPLKSAPLLVVFGGTVVDGRTSGDYMWDFMNDLKDKFHIFVADNNSVKGKEAFDALTDKITKEGLTPSKQILYLFSGGWRPGIPVLRDVGAKQFSAIFLVDIWMGVGDVSGTMSPDFYKALVDKESAKITYIFTRNGPDNPDLRDAIKKKLGDKATFVDYQKGVDHTKTHMSTNTVAVGLLK
jgi:hypothetical protein